MADPDRYAAFLRAINVGGHNVKMDRLRELFRGMGFGDVATHIASGNVLFTAQGASASGERGERGERGASTERGELEARIETRLGEAVGFPVVTLLRTPQELAEVLASDPFKEGCRIGCPTAYVGFTRAPLDGAEAERVLALATDQDVVRVVGAEIYWLPPDGKVSQSKLTNAAFEKALGRPATFRNERTVAAVAGKLTPTETA